MNEMNFKIRRATKADGDAAHKMIVSLGYPNISRDDFHRQFLELLAHQDSLVYLAEDYLGLVLGLMTISHRPQLRLAGILVCIDELVVAGEARGQGVGGALINEAKALAMKLNASRLELHTNRGRVSYQRKFYVKNGFTEANSAVMRLEKESLKS